MIAALCILHGIGVGASFVGTYLFCNFVPGEKMPTWKIVLGSLVWEGVVVYCACRIVFEIAVYKFGPKD